MSPTNPSKERTSVRSTGSTGSRDSTGSTHITTTIIENKDPIEFLKVKGYKVTGTLGEGSFAK